jgi:hypothetical protein
VRALGDQDLVTVAEGGLARGRDVQDVLLDGQVDRGGVHARQVELDDELVAVPIGVHRGPAPRGLPKDLLCDLVQLAERVEAHQHGLLLSLVAVGCVPDGTLVEIPGIRGVDAPRLNFLTR